MVWCGMVYCVLVWCVVVWEGTKKDKGQQMAEDSWRRVKKQSVAGKVVGKKEEEFLK